MEPSPSPSLPVNTPLVVVEENSPWRQVMSCHAAAACGCSGVAQKGVITFQKNKSVKRVRERKKGREMERERKVSTPLAALIAQSQGRDSSAQNHKLSMKFMLQPSPVQSSPPRSRPPRFGISSGRKKNKIRKRKNRKANANRRICMDDFFSSPSKPLVLFLRHILPLSWPLIQLNSAVCPRFPSRWRGGLPAHHIFHKAFFAVAALQNVLTHSCSALGKTWIFQHVSVEIFSSNYY